MQTKRIRAAVVIAGSFLLSAASLIAREKTAQEKTAQEKTAQEKTVPPEAKEPARPRAEYSGMYGFLREGEFVQVTVEDEGRVTGFVSRYGDLDSDRGAFLDQFFKSGKLNGSELSFTTEVAHGTQDDFKGKIE